MVWFGSIKVGSLPLGFSLISILDSEPVGWVTGLIISSPRSLFSSSLILPYFCRWGMGGCNGRIQVGVLGGSKRFPASWFENVGEVV